MGQEAIGNRQDEINNLLKNAALAAIDYADKNLTLDLNYTVTLKTKKLISVQYGGFLNISTAAHPTNYFCTVNIDLETGKKLYLQDMVEVDDGFVNKILNQGNNENRDLTSTQCEYIKSYLLDSRLQIDWNTIIFDNNSFYLTPDHLGISFPIIHALRDHIEYEIPYQKIGILS